LQHQFRSNSHALGWRHAVSGRTFTPQQPHCEDSGRLRLSVCAPRAQLMPGVR
jgi:hypothetical protein